MKVFSAGADLKERETMTDLEVIDTVKYMRETVNNIEQINENITIINNKEENNCVIITSQGEKVFYAGADLKERETMTDLEVIETVKYIGETVNNIEQIKVPVIAAMNGSAFGGGLELALA